MARQTGIVKLQGTIDGITFLRTIDGDIARKAKAPVPKEVLKTSPNYQPTRDCNTEFGTASRSGKLVREAINELLILAKDGRVSSRLNSRMLKVIQSDPVNPRGERMVLKGDIGLLKNFECNANASLSEICKFSFDTEIKDGIAKIHIDDFIPDNAIKATPGTTHFMLHSLGTEINFSDMTFNSSSNHTELFTLGDKKVPASNLEHTYNHGTTNPVLILFGITFFQFVNGVHYPFSNNSYNSLRIIDVGLNHA